MGELLADFYDPATCGLFAQHLTDPQQQRVLLAAVDKQLSEEEQAQCQGEQGDGTISLEEAHAALRSLPRGKSRAVTGSPMSSTLP